MGLLAMPAKVLLINAYSAGNLGDRAIVEAMVRGFYSRGCSLCIVSDDPGDAGAYSAAVIQEPLGVWGRVGRPVPRAIAESARIAEQQLRIQAYTRRMRAADVVVSVGGGYLYDDGSIGAKRNLARRLHYLTLAARSGRPCVLFSQSVGPFAGPASRRLTGAVVRRMSAVAVREEISLEECRQMGAESAHLCDDVVFAEGWSRTSGRGEAIARRLWTAEGAPLAVTVLDWKFGGDKDWQGRQERYLAAVAAVLRSQARRTGRRVAVVSQVVAHDGDRDDAVGRQLVQRVGASLATEVSLAELSTDDIVDFYRHCELLIASRMHSAIFALIAGTPTIALAYLPKSTGIMQRLGQGSLVLPMAELQMGDLEVAVAGVLADRRTAHLKVVAAVERARASAQACFDLSLAVIGNDASRGRCK